MHRHNNVSYNRHNRSYAGLAFFKRAFGNYCAVIGALVLRDMRTRFGRSHWGFLMSILWPFAHLSFLMGLRVFLGRVAQIGGDPAVFFASGLLPYILILYPSRLMLYAIASNKPLLYFPVVKSIDLIVSKSIVEVISSFIIVILFGMLLVYGFGVNISPNDEFQMLMALLASVYASFCLGVLNAFLYSVWKVWMILFVVGMLTMYFSSGAFFLMGSMPQDIQDILWYNPLAHIVEWYRVAYYEGYISDFLSRSYVFGFCTILFAVGFLGERFLRGRVLHQ